MTIRAVFALVVIFVMIGLGMFAGAIYYAARGVSEISGMPRPLSAVLVAVLSIGGASHFLRVRRQ